MRIGWVVRVTGCHVIEKGDHKLAPKTALKIIQSGGLMVNQAAQGTAAYAFYADMVPNSRRRFFPMVVFEVDEKYITRRPAPLPQKHDYAYMQMSGSLFAIIPVYILGFVNLPNFYVYTHPIGFFN